MASEGYAVLAVNDYEDDRFIRLILEQGGVTNVISESSQYVPIDDFGALRLVSLDNFHNEIAYFDPRDTGYAAKLRDFFVHGGNRFFFIPLEGVAGNRVLNLNNKLDAILYGIPFSLVLRGQTPPFLIYFILLALGSALTFYFSQSRRQFLYHLPVLLAMGWGGFPAIILAAFLCGIWELLREPLRELAAAGLTEKGVFNYAGTGFRGGIERLKPFKINLSIAFFFLLFILIFSSVSEISFIPIVVACLSFFILNFISFQVEKERMRKNRHIPFTPVLLFPVKTRTFSFFPFLLPFVVVSLLAISFPRIFPGFSPQHENTALINPRYLVSADDYYRHMAFQRSFQYRSLNHQISSGFDNPFYLDAYLRYYLEDDGLISGNISPAFSLREDTAFPLETLMVFLVNYDWQPAAQPAGNVINLVELISLLLILTTCIMDAIRPMVLPRKKIPVFRDKRIAA